MRVWEPIDSTECEQPREEAHEVVHFRTHATVDELGNVPDQRVMIPTLQ